MRAMPKMEGVLLYDGDGILAIVIEGVGELAEDAAIAVLQEAEENADVVKDGTDVEVSSRQQIDDAGNGFAEVETVDAKVTQKEAEDEGNDFVLGGGRIDGLCTHDVFGEAERVDCSLSILTWA